ncbi:CRISPR-associated endonuclease Cas2 [Neolewinella lacunae]|uniref:CRISPR-associated endoribonuclease Cas2 n=1 Tax=Neolewinella lacunae TaxID=1517758 RepID=A0A923PMQ1_9BACT|nr:CRISPR-associated endonuclease Cas2 [Neolewinella lacunae]MBC6995255.1 CRISPR-associated endonuclease Cas2 [Neolewinella lacunae]MDN3635436.1 CRISPR-associated endonuclease Cas2 [Neolewinella lacunae]
MAKKQRRSLQERLEGIVRAGIQPPPARVLPEDQLPELSERVAQILGILQADPIKATNMVYLIMYDITDNKVRREIADYLITAGCTRIQKSVYLIKTANARFEEIHATLRDVNGLYANEDSIILVPVNSSDVRAMKLIGQNVDIQLITDPPNTLFF